MNNNIRKYTIDMVTAGPVFIGSGEETLKKNYIYSVKEKKIIYPNIKRMMKYFESKNLLDSYTQFLLDDNQKNIDMWITRNKVNMNDIRFWTQYSIDASSVEFKKNKNNQITFKNIMMFVKDAYGKPYIPGSSIKGAIRTALIVYDIHNNPEKYNSYRELINNILDFDDNKKKLKELSNIIGRLENQTFNFMVDFNNKKFDKSKMSSIIVGDSLPIELSNLMLAQSIDYTERKGKASLPIYYEAIKPGVKIRFDITIDNEQFDYSIDYILEAINYYNRLINRIFFSKFNKDKNEKNILFLGGKAGFHTKTLLLELFKNNYLDVLVSIFDMTTKGKGRIAEHDEDYDLGYSPRTYKMSKYVSQYYKTGECKITNISYDYDISTT